MSTPEQTKRPDQRPALAQALAGLAWALALGGLVWLVASWAGLPAKPAGALLRGVWRPAGWLPFMALFAPLSLWLLESVAGFLRQGAAPWLPDRAARPLWLPPPALLAGSLWLALVAACASRLAAWPLAAGGGYLAALAWAGCQGCRCLFKAAGQGEETPALDRFLALGAAALAAAFFIGASFWTVQAVSTSGDEPAYLMQADHLWRAITGSDGDAGDPASRSAYYWGRWHKGFAHASINAKAFLALVAVPAALAGRVGALALLSLLAGLCLFLFYRLARGAGYSPQSALWGLFMLAAAAPFASLNQHIYPGIFGVLGVLAGLYVIGRLAVAPWTMSLALFGVALAMVLIKIRLAPPALGLLLAGWITLLLLPNGKKAAWVWLGAAVLGLAGLAGLARLLAPEFLGRALMLLRMSANLPYWPTLQEVALAGAAMFLDQQFGLLFHAPWFALGLVGLPAFCRDQPRLAWQGGLVALFTLGSLLWWRTLQWDGGFTPACRFLAPLFPLLALCSLAALPRLAGRAGRILWAGILLFHLAVGYALLLAPIWRFHRRTGVNHLAREIGGLFDSDLHRFLPSFLQMSWPDWWPALALALGFLAWALVLLRLRPGRLVPPRPVHLALAGAGLALCLAALLLAGRLIPTAQIQAESMNRRGAGLYGDYFPRPIFVVLARPGQEIWHRVVLPKEPSSLLIVGRYNPVACKGPNCPNCPGKPGAPECLPLVGVYLDDQLLARVRFLAGQKSFRLALPPRPGLAMLKLRLLSAHGRDQVILDRVLIEPR